MAVGELSLDAEAADELSPAPAQLGLPGRLVVGLLIVAGLAVGTTDPFGLVWFVVYGGVGAVLVIRRPHISIGWLLLALGWGHVLAALPADTDGTALASAGAYIAGAIWPLVFVLYAALALIVPSGHLPRGRWGLIARVLISVDVACVVLNVLLPVLADAVVLPMVVVLLVSLASLVVRMARAEGIERQQLRWIVAALTCVVAAVVAGLVIGTVVPSAGESGVVWIPAALAFPTVPGAIGIAVMRYRLYEIDTIINRAIVYGLLTAILAGGSAAVIGIAERLFEGYVGPGSDSTVVLTTLIVVAAFNPLKGRLQSIVDRRFKEDPATALAKFVDDLHGWPGALSMERTLRAFLVDAIGAFRALGGVAIVSQGNGSDRSISVGDMSNEMALTASVSRGDFRAVLRLNGNATASRAAALRRALAAVVDELTESTDERWIALTGEADEQSGALAIDAPIGD
jgi:hypothetical protein